MPKHFGKVLNLVAVNSVELCQGEVDVCQVEELTKLHRRLQSKHRHHYLILMSDTTNRHIVYDSVW